MKKKLHELIEMAMNGQMFQAWMYETIIFNQNDFKKKGNWIGMQVVADWTVVIEEPKKTVYEYLWRSSKESPWRISTYLYLNDDDFKSDMYGYEFMKSGRSFEVPE